MSHDFAHFGYQCAEHGRPSEHNSVSNAKLSSKLIGQFDPLRGSPLHLTHSNADVRHHSSGYWRAYLFDIPTLEASPRHCRGYPRVTVNDRASLTTEDCKNPESEDQARSKRFQIVGIASAWIGR